MKKLLLSVLIIVASGITASSQTGGNLQKLSIGVDYAIPFGTRSTYFGVGGSFQYEYPVAKSLSLTATAGYLSMITTGGQKKNLESLGLRTSSGVIPAKLGAKYYFGRHFYTTAEAGIAYFTGSETAQFTYAPGVGLSLPIKGKSSLDFGVRFDTWTSKPSTSNFLGLRAAYSFGW